MIFCKSSIRGLVFITPTLRLRLVQQRTGVVWDQLLCSSDVKQFVEKDADLFHSTFVTLLRNSSDPFVSKLLSGPGLAPKRHMSFFKLKPLGPCAGYPHPLNDRYSPLSS